MQAHWLDEIPVVPLEGPVPVVVTRPIPHGIYGRVQYHAFYLFDARAERGDRVIVQPDDRGDDVCEVGRALVRIDLDHPQGVAYALRQLRSSGGRGGLRQLIRWWLGETTDGDRLLIARALREVHGG